MTIRQNSIHIQTIKDYKSIKSGRNFDLPPFTVLTGKNGSGKSHLMEALSQEECAIVSNDQGKRLNKVKYIAFNGLNPKINSDGNYLEITNERKNAWNNIYSIIQNYKKSTNGRNINFIAWLRQRTDYEKKIISPILELAENDIDKITEEFFNNHFQIVQDDMFTSMFASIFKLYQMRYCDNELIKFENYHTHKSKPYLEEEDFINHFGPRPWELVNDILAEAQLSYRVNEPDMYIKELDFHLCLRDINTGIEIQVNDLSTGEKVLMSLALSIYNSKEETARPNVLCIDEPDAPLHPEFSRVLIDSIVKHIVGNAGVKVIISTHSPTTVALAPEESLFIMDKEAGIPRKITKREGINLLTQDIENMRLSIEDRRQIFVENKNDVNYYQRLYSYMNITTSITPQFLPARPGDGCNCEDVKNMTNGLRNAGNDLVYGVIDYDGKNKGNLHVKVVGNGNRYAIENYIFDPIFVALLLIRERILENTIEIGTSQNLSFTKLHGAKEEDLQKLIDWVESSLELKIGEEVKVNTINGYRLQMNKSYLLNQGHDLETKILDKWIQLKKYTKRGESEFKKFVLDNIIKEYPEYLSTDILDLFKSFA